jgi:hypothetical protein
VSKTPTDIMQVFKKLDLEYLIFALQIFFSFILLIESFNIEVQVIQLGVWVSQTIRLGYDLEPILLVLLLVWALLFLQNSPNKQVFIPILILFTYHFIGLELSIALSSLIASIIGFQTKRKIQSLLTWFLIIIGIFEAITVFYWLLVFSFKLSIPIESIALFEQQLYYFYVGSAPIYYLFFILVGILKGSWLLKEDLMEEDKNLEFDNFYHKPVKRKTIILGFAILFSILLALYPYLLSDNPLIRYFGVDVDEYVNVYSIVESNPLNAFAVENGNRSIFYLILYLFQKISGFTTRNAVIFLPIILNPLFTYSSYMLGEELFQDANIVESSLIFAAFGFPLVIGLYAYYLTNILALSLIYFSLAYLFATIRLDNIKKLIISIIFGTLMVFTHPWTFDQFFIALILLTSYIFYSNYRKKQPDKASMYLVVYIISLILVEALNIIIIGSGGIYATLEYTERIISIQNFWSSLESGTKWIFGGLLANFPIIIFSIIGLLTFNVKTISRKFLCIFMIVSCVLFIPSDYEIKSRLLYNLPFHYISAYGLHKIITYFDKNVGKTILFTSYLFIFTYSIRSLANMVI